MTCLFDKRNYLAPLKRPKRMLDIGCGTGIWCMEMGTSAAQHPRNWQALTTDSERVPTDSGRSCGPELGLFLTAPQIEGIDLSPIQPDVTPDNVDFFIDDIRRKEWWACTQPYDYIHTRMSLGIFEDFREIIQKGFNNLEPGGYMESQEIYSKVYCDDGTMPADYELLKWTKAQDTAAMKLGVPLRIANKLKTWYEQAGFVDVYEEIFAIPINTWPSDSRAQLFGKFMRWNMLLGVHAWTVDYFVKALGWTETEVQVYLAHLRTAINDTSVHSYYKV